MRRLVQLSVLLALTTPGVLLIGPVTGAQAASGKTAKPGLLQTAWFWQTAAEQANPPVPPPAPPPTEPSGVPKGDLGVAHTSNDASSSKMAVLAFKVAALKDGVGVQDFTFSITLDSAGTNLNSAAAPVVACLPTRLWPAADGGDYTDEPTVDCSDKVAAKVKGDTYTFAIPAIAQSWADDTNLGVALVNDPDNTGTPFQTVFSAKSVKATMTYSTPLPMPSSTGTTTPPGASGGSTSGGGTTGSSANTGSSSTAGAPAPVDIPSTGPATTTNTGPAAPPVVAPSTTTPASAVHPLKAASSLPNGAFWIAAIAIALLIVVAGAVLADDAVPVPTATTSRLGRALRERERVRRQQQQTETPATLTPQRV